MQPFDLLGPLPAERSTTVLQASAGTGKTFALAGLVTRYLAEGTATLDQMLLITFSRAASQELRERVRHQIAAAVAAFDDPSIAKNNELVAFLLQGNNDALRARERRLRDALAGFDAATIATTHQFCQLVLKSLGVAGDSASNVTLLESLDDLTAEIVADLYLAHFGQERDDPVLQFSAALRLAREVVNNPAAELRPRDPDLGSEAAARIDFAKGVLVELETRKRRLGVLSYDDLLSRLASALDTNESPARARMRHRWPIVMVDEFQDTDEVQWQVIDRAFSGHSTVILIGDPKQAIYAFRGGDVVTYLEAAKTAGEQKTLATNWRSDSALLDRLQVVLRGAQLGDAAIVVDDVEAHHRGHRLAGAPHNDPFRLRVVDRATLGRRGVQNPPIAVLREHISADLAADVRALLAGGATFDGEPVRARDIAVIVERHKDAEVCFQALCDAGIPVVYTGNTDVFTSEAAADWLCLLEAFDQPHRPGMVRAAAATVFFGETAETLVAGGDPLTDRIADTLREWAAHARERGVAAVYEAAQLRGMGDRVLSWEDGERQMTDLAHVTQLLQDVAHHERLGLPGLRDWLRKQRNERSGATERNRRLDSDATAVQVMTVYAAKGLQFPVVYVPFAFNRYVQDYDLVVFHDDGARCLYIGGQHGPGVAAAKLQGRREDASDVCRLSYVAMTRAQSQVVVWWAPARDEPTGGLSRLLRGRRPGEPVVPDRCDPPKITDDDAMARFREWEAAGGPVIEASVAAAAPLAPPAPAPSDLEIRHFHRSIDTGWRRTSYSGLIRIAEAVGVTSEPEVTELDDETGDISLTENASGPLVVSPMAALPRGATFGSLVHAVLEKADPAAADFSLELETHAVRELSWWSVDVSASELAAAMLPMHDTSLGPLTGGSTLRQIGLSDRLRELDFEIPLAGGDVRGAAPNVSVSDIGELLSAFLPDDDPFAPYVDRLTSAALGNQSLRGYLSGSIDAVLRLPDQRFVVVDYKTNYLGDTAADYSAGRLAEAMLHSDYPLQALLYTVVLHRFLRWRVHHYDPATHLGGVLYLFVRGMCGAETPVIDGQPCGVFSWQPPAGLAVALSDLLDSGEGGGVTVELAVNATGLLETFNEAGVLDVSDVRVADRICLLGKESDERVALAVALLVRGLRGGSVCIELATIPSDIGVDDVPWPSSEAWLAAVRDSPLLGQVLHLYDDRLLYLDRYWREEKQVCDDLLALEVSKPGGDVPASERLFPAGFEEQREAAEIALAQSVTVLTGGPGTGKTTTVARLLALLAEQAGASRLRIALAAPTGKAAARLAEAVQLEVASLDAADQARLGELQAMTLHRLLGSKPDTSSRFKHDRGNRLPHDVIVVDETSMVSLTMMARLLEAVRPDARLILVGDADQLASVEAGAVLADLVDGISARSDMRVATLKTSHRFGKTIGLLAEAIRVGDADQALELLHAGGEHIEFIEADSDALRSVLVPHALRLREAALYGADDVALTTLDEHRLLCAHREGPHGVRHWNRQVEQWLSEETGQPPWSEWYPGRPLLVTANDHGLHIYNGDTGVVVARADGLRAVIAAAGGPKDFATSRLSDVETMHAMTIHKSQGSQADEVTVLMPGEDSRLLTRELFYTAVTRAKKKVRVVGERAAVRGAIERRALRATGLRERLRSSPASLDPCEESR